MHGIEMKAATHTRQSCLLKIRATCNSVHIRNNFFWRFYHRLKRIMGLRITKCRKNMWFIPDCCKIIAPYTPLSSFSLFTMHDLEQRHLLNIACWLLGTEQQKTRNDDLMVNSKEKKKGIISQWLWGPSVYGGLGAKDRVTEVTYELLKLQCYW